MSFKIKTNLLFFFFFGYFFSFSEHYVFAQNITDPNFPNSQEKPIYISVSNLPVYQQYLLDRFVYWIKEQKIYPRVINKLEYENAYSEEWITESNANAEQFTLDEHNLIKSNSNYQYRAGFPFGLKEEINSETDPSIKAMKILWNLTLVPNLQQNILYNINYNWLGAQSLLKKANAQILRSFDRQLFLNSTEDKFYIQSILKYLTPSILTAYSYISKIGYSKEKLWVFSNILNNLRSVPVEIKGDKLLGCNLNYDDMFVWNGNPNTVTAKVISEKELLLPFPSLSKYNFLNTDIVNNVKPDLDKTTKSIKQDKVEDQKDLSTVTIRGNKQKNDGTFTFNIFNFESQQYAQLPPWSPISNYWVPRKVWVIELIHKSGLYPYYKEELVVDQNFFIPYLKVSYSYQGTEEKVLFSSWAVAELKDKSFSTPFLTFATAVDNTNSVVCTQNTESVFITENANHSKIKALLDAQVIESYKSSSEEKEKPKVKEEEQKTEREYLD